MATAIFILFGFMLLLAVLHSLRRITSWPVIRGILIVLPLAFCAAMGVAFIAPQKVGSFYHVFLSQHRFYPFELMLGAIVLVGCLLPLAMIARYHQALSNRIGVHPVTLIVAMVLITFVAALPGWLDRQIFPAALSPNGFNVGANHITNFLALLGPGTLLSAAFLVFGTFAIFGAIMLTHHLLGPVFAVMSLGIALSGILNEKVSVIDHRAFFEFLDAAGLKGDLLHYIVLGISIVWGLHDVIFNPRELFRFGGPRDNASSEVTSRLDSAG